MRIVFIGDMTLGSNSRRLYDGLKSLDNEVYGVDIAHCVRPRPGSPTWVRIHRSRSLPSSLNTAIRERLRDIVARKKPQMLFAVKTVLLDQELLLEAPIGFKLHLSFDDVSNPFNTTPQYLATESQWNLVVTNKRHNVDELHRRGVAAVEYIWGGYDPRNARIVTPIEQREYDAGFIGAARPDRLDLPRRLAEIRNVKCVVVGPRWRRQYPLGCRGVKILPMALADNYTVRANQIRIGIVLLNSDNRDQHTNRTFETAAVGQLVLAQRTEEHAELFEEDREAVFFDGNTELQLKIAELCHQPERVRNVASAGYRRIMSGRNTWKDRVEQILTKVMHLQ